MTLDELSELLQQQRFRRGENVIVTVEVCDFTRVHPWFGHTLKIESFKAAPGELVLCTEVV